MNRTDFMGLSDEETPDETPVCFINGFPIYSGDAHLCSEDPAEKEKKPKITDAQKRERVERAEKEILQDAVDRAIDALGKKECRELFGTEETRARGFDPSVVLSSIASGGKFGRVKFQWKGASCGVAKTTVMPPLLSGSATITINTYSEQSDYWNDGNGYGNAAVLLHELGHAYDGMRGAGGSVFKSPDGLPWQGDKAGRWNDWKIDQACFGGILGTRIHMSNIAAILGVLLVPAIAVGQDAASIKRSTAASGQSVCAAAKIASEKHVLIYGVAGITSDGLVMADYSCALAVGPHGGLPVMILVHVEEFAKPEDKQRFDVKNSSRRLAREAMFGIRLYGDLECQMKFSIQFNEQGEFVGANGFGHQGLAKCRVGGAKILRLDEIKQDAPEPQ